MDELVIVDWRDASFHHDDTELPDDYLVRTVGWIIAETPTFLTIASERLPDGHRAVTMVPTSCVMDVSTLEIAPTLRNTSGLEAFAAPA
jgi:hypothetical protein